MTEPVADRVVLVCGNSGTYAHLPSESDPTSPRCSECFGDTDRGARETSECPVCGAEELVSLANHLWAHCEDAPLGDDRR